jgi:hypothetical protein
MESLTMRRLARVNELRFSEMTADKKGDLLQKQCLPKAPTLPTGR